jgi:hypothetical protein
VSFPTPVNDVPPQQIRYDPVVESANAAKLGFESSCIQISNVDTVNMQLAVLPAASVAVQVTVEIPIGNADPDGGVHTAVTPGQLSVAVGGG